MFDIEETIDSPEFVDLLPDPTRQLLWGVADRFHDALPFTEPERRWLLRSHRQIENGEIAVASGPGRYTASLEALEGPIVNAGRPEIVRGSELVRRWWDWTRGVGAFEGSDGHTLAHEALADFVVILRRPYQDYLRPMR